MVMNTDIYHYIIDFFKKKRNLLLVGIILIIIFSSTMVFIFASHPNEYIIEGTVFIDSSPAPSGVDVTIVFSNGKRNDTSGTDEVGRYRIDVSDNIGDVATFFITYNGVVYQGRNHTGDYVNISLSGSNQILSVDLYVDTSNIDFSDTDSDNESDDDNSDDSIDETDTEESDETQDTTNDSDDTNPDDPSDGSDDSDDDNDDTADDSDQGPTDDEDEEEETEDDEESEDEEQESVLLVEKKIWDETTNTWIKDTIVDPTKHISFKITLHYSGEHMIDSIDIVDELPIGLEYMENATIDGILVEPSCDPMNNTLHWHLDNLSFNKTMVITYNCSISKSGSLVNRVTVNATENTTKTFTLNDTATVTVSGDIVIKHHVWDNKTSSWVQEYTTDVGECVQFKISILYNGSFTAQNLTVFETLPSYMDYMGGAMVNGVLNEPNSDNGTLEWDIGSLTSQQVCSILFNVNIAENGTDTTLVRVIGAEDITMKQFNDTSFVRVTGEAPKHTLCMKKVRIGNGSWEKSIHGFVGSIATFNITIFNNGNTTLYNIHVFDTLPPSLTYIPNSTWITHNSLLYHEEPYVDQDQHYLLWSNLNSIIHDYVSPGEHISIYFNTTISSDGLLINTVNVTSTICNECDPLDISAIASINATEPIQELAVKINGPYIERPLVPIYVSANATGGIPPYRYVWDLDEDGVFNDGNTSSVIRQWDEIGNYTLKVQVYDTENQTQTHTSYANISIPPLIVDAGGPYQTFAGDTISFQATATGGMMDYVWSWDFGDGNTSVVKDPIHRYQYPGIYTATVFVTDADNLTKNDTSLVTITEKDILPPIILVEQPINAIYLKNRPIFPFFAPFIFGEIQINVSAVDEGSFVEKIEIYINDILVDVWYDSSISWTWSEQIFGRRKLTIIAYDTLGNFDTFEQMVWKFF